MRIPIVYPMPDYENKVMNFVQWSENKSAIPKNSGVVILQEFEDKYRVFITPSGMIFNIDRDKVLIEDFKQINPLEAYGFL
jgi:hypothetical protein